MVCQTLSSEGWRAEHAETRMGISALSTFLTVLVFFITLVFFESSRYGWWWSSHNQLCLLCNLYHMERLCDPVSRWGRCRETMLRYSFLFLSALFQSLTLTKAAHHLHQQCEASKWLEESNCFNSAVLGVAIRRPDDDYTFEPASMEQRMMTAIRCIGLPVAFSMSSDITSTVFTQISPYQTELVIQPRGTRIPIVDSLLSIPSRSFEIRQSLACLVKEENVVLLLANTAESALAHGRDVEQMLMETVRHCRHHDEDSC